jgi:hypothetical protein
MDKKNAQHPSKTQEQKKAAPLKQNPSPSKNPAQKACK